MKRGYARESRLSDSLATQRDALRAAVIYEDPPSVKGVDLGIGRLLADVEPGDTVAVTTLDRLGRSLSAITDLIDAIRDRGGALRTLDNRFDWPTLEGLVDLHRLLVRDRANAARAVAHATGKQTGRPPSVDEARAAEARKRRAAGDRVAEIGRALGVSRATLYRDLGRDDPEASQ